MKICPKCGWENDDDFNFCLGCGAQLPAQEAAPAPAPTPAPAQPSSPPAPAPQPQASPARLVLLLPNGQEGGTYPLKPDKTLIGRKQGNILFLDDPYVSPLHATFYRTPDGALKVRDENSLNGLFLRLRERVPIDHQDILLLGKQLLRFESLNVPAETKQREFDHNNPPATPRWGSPDAPYWGRLVQVISEGRQGNAVLLGGPQIDLGRERGQLTFPGDRFISAIHARVSFDNKTFFAEDLGSRNGTFIRIREEITLQQGDILIIGEQLLRVELNG